MTLLAPHWLWLLALLGGGVVAYLVVQHRRRPTAVRHPDLDLVVAVAPRSGAWRRHLTAATMLLALVGLVLGLARPAQAQEQPRDDAVIMLALDTSSSMRATDIAPNRLEVAISAAQDFVGDAPDGYRIGLVTYGSTASVVVPPTTDREILSRSLDQLQAGGATATGDAVLAALDALQGAADPGAVVTGDDGAYQAIVLLSDGYSTEGATLEEVAAKAKDQDVPIFTVAYGTPDGVLGSGPDASPVPSDPASMAQLAEATGGRTYEATSAGALSAVYDQITTQISTVTAQVELTVPLAAAAAVALAAAVAMSMAWSPRIS
ncbi:MAG: VWA domain-containing protein [Actinobacteria bacterium]|nr:VWA domain-containing protein [Actinomycetota bacterium]